MGKWVPESESTCLAHTIVWGRTWSHLCPSFHPQSQVLRSRTKVADWGCVGWLGCSPVLCSLTACYNLPSPASSLQLLYTWALSSWPLQTFETATPTLRKAIFNLKKQILKAAKYSPTVIFFQGCLLLIEFDKLRNWDSEKLSNWPKVSQLRKAEPGFSLAHLTPAPSPALRCSLQPSELSSKTTNFHCMPSLSFKLIPQYTMTLGKFAKNQFPEWPACKTNKH